jgi:hypothetical protein
MKERKREREKGERRKAFGQLGNHLIRSKVETFNFEFL